MKIENLIAGMVIKNYKELAELMGWKQTNGKGREYQFEELSSLCTWHKEGHKIIIDKILPEPIIKEDNKKLHMTKMNINRGKFSKEVFPLVKDYIGRNDVEYCSKGNMLKHLKLKNNNYNVAYLYPKGTAKFISDKLGQDITANDVQIISTAIYDIGTNKINNAFNNLQKLNYISDYTNKLLIIYSEENNNFSVATVYECEVINKCISNAKRQLLLQSLGEQTFSELMEYYRNNFINEDDIERELNIQIFLRGIYRRLQYITLKNIKLEGLGYITNFYYAYGYIKNEDIEWNEELLNIAQKEIHLENYRNAVKETCLMDSFLEKMDENYISNLNKTLRKVILRNKFKEHIEVYMNKVNLLLDIFMLDKPQFYLDKFTMRKIEYQLNKEEENNTNGDIDIML